MTVAEMNAALAPIADLKVGTRFHVPANECNRVWALTVELFWIRTHGDVHVFTADKDDAGLDVYGQSN